jgi:hypothetical protein
MIIQSPRPCRNTPNKKKLQYRFDKGHPCAHRPERRIRTEIERTEDRNTIYGTTSPTDDKQLIDKLATSLLTGAFISHPGRGKCHVVDKAMGHKTVNASWLGRLGGGEWKTGGYENLNALLLSHPKWKHGSIYIFNRHLFIYCKYTVRVHAKGRKLVILLSMSDPVIQIYNIYICWI